MLPECRGEGDLFSIPQFTAESEDVEGFWDELKSFHNEFRDCFQRSETRENVFLYMVGQFSDQERKSIEPIALNVEDGGVRSMQRAVSDAVWDEERLLDKYRSLVDEDLGDRDGVLIFDESGFSKKGNDSAGVARQYNGNTGKVDNCQVGVFAAYASRHGYALVDKRLFVPEKWFEAEYEQRRKKCKMPENLEFRSKPELAVEMLNEISGQNKLPYKYVVADSLYGNSPEFIEALEKMDDKIYFVSVSRDTQVFLRQPVTMEKRYKYKGETRTKEVLKDSGDKPVEVFELAENLNDYFWYRRKVSEGTKGPIVYEFSRKKVVISKGGMPDRPVWLIMRRTIEESPTYSYFISNAPPAARLHAFVWLSGIRWAIEQCFEETKSELGMDQYEVRKFPGWNHHILTCMLAHFFLWHLKIRLGKKSAGHYFIAA